MKVLFEIIQTISKGGAKVNPTEIYNEGWMTRLLIHCSVREKLTLRNEEGEDMIDFGSISNWTSEALISSPFVKAKNKREGYTHADMVLGDFKVNFQKGSQDDSTKGENKGLIKVDPKANIFGIIEAKMGSPLSKGTKHAENYNQAVRTVACIIYNTINYSNCDTFFYVVAPKEKIFTKKEAKREWTKMLEIDNIKENLKDRFNIHNNKNDKIENEKLIIERTSNCRVGVISYEYWIEQITNKKAKKELETFYEDCKKWNKITQTFKKGLL
jgi:hypothetical protein